jgi:shikimate kinase
VLERPAAPAFDRTGHEVATDEIEWRLPTTDPDLVTFPERFEKVLVADGVAIMLRHVDLEVDAGTGPILARQQPVVSDGHIADVAGGQLRVGAGGFTVGQATAAAERGGCGAGDGAALKADFCAHRPSLRDLAQFRLRYDRRVEQPANGVGGARPAAVILVGMMGSGKSTVGRALSDRTGWRYVDNDDLVRSFGGRGATDIRAADGEAALHDVEKLAFDASLAIEPPVIIGAAASVVLDPVARVRLRSGPRVVWLRARPETLLAHVGDGTGRRAEATDPAWIAARAAERAPLYAEVASQVIDVDDRSPDEVADLILEGLSAR